MRPKSLDWKNIALIILLASLALYAFFRFLLPWLLVLSVWSSFLLYLAFSAPPVVFNQYITLCFLTEVYILYNLTEVYLYILPIAFILP